MPKKSKPGSADYVADDEIEALVKAIKFENFGFSTNQVHQEILRRDDRYHSVDVKRVRRALQKLQGTTPAAPDGQVPSLFTVGHESKSEEYTPAEVQEARGGVEAAAAPPTQAAAEEEAGEEEEDEGPDPWVPIELDIPMDRTGVKKYESLISLNKGQGRDRRRDRDRSRPGQEIYKVQVTGFNSQMPMLIYNQSKRRKTFLHPDNTEAFRKIQETLQRNPIMGVAGPMGGLKAYFYAKPSTMKKVVLFDTSELAPAQRW